MWVAMFVACVVAQAYLTGFYTAQDELRTLMTQEDWLLTLQVAGNK